MRRIIFLLVAFFTLLSTDLVEYTYMQKDDTQAHMKALYIYNFAQNIEWPNKDGNFVITVLGENPGMMAELNKLAARKNIGQQKIEVQAVDQVKDMGKCHILYITPDKSGLLGDAVAKFKGKGTLIITEKPGMAKVGAVINYIVKESKLVYELNKSAAHKAGLKVAAVLEQTAANVIN